MTLTLTERLAEIDEEIRVLKTKRASMIEAEPATFSHLKVPMWIRSNERYIIVYGDGSQSLRHGGVYAQRPAAFRHARSMSGRYVWDRREGIVYDAHENVLMHVEAS